MKRFGPAFVYALAAGPAFAEPAGMPQMNPEWFANQLVWLAVCFALLYCIVSSYIAPRVGSVLEKREAAVNDAIAKAEALKAAAASTRGDMESTDAEARAKAAATIAKAVADAAADANAAQAQLASELEVRAQASQDRIGKAVAKAAKEMDAAVQSLAAAMSTKLLEGSTAAAKPTKKAS